MEYRDEDARDGEADDEVIAPKEDAAKLDNREDAVLEEDAVAPGCQTCNWRSAGAFRHVVVGEE